MFIGQGQSTNFVIQTFTIPVNLDSQSIRINKDLNVFKYRSAGQEYLMLAI